MNHYQSTIFKTLVLASVLSSSVVVAQNSPSTAATVAVAAAATSSSPSCALMDPQVFTQNAVNQVLGVLNNDKSEITSNFPAVQNDIQNVLKPLIGIDAMVGFVVSSNLWSQASPAEQAAFEVAFLQYIIGLYSSPLKKFDQQIIEVYKVRGTWGAPGQNVQINTMIHNPAAGPSADIPVSFILQQNGCTWLFVDFVVDGISAMSNIQQQIQSIVQNMQNPRLSDLTKVIVAHVASTN